MKSVEFCYWLQGFFELADETNLTIAQVNSIKKHLSLVFKHEIDPSYPDSKKLSHLHNKHDPNAIIRC